MASFNKVILMGNLTRDPELSYTASSTAICKFGLAVNRKWRGADGNQRDDTCFVDCTAFGKAGETLNQYMKKGNPLLVDGRLQFSKWTGKDGQNRSKLEVVVENFQFLGGGRSDGEGARPAPAAQAAQHSGSPASAPAGDYEPPPADVGGDIPF